MEPLRFVAEDVSALVATSSDVIAPIRPLDAQPPSHVEIKSSLKLSVKHHLSK